MAQYGKPEYWEDRYSRPDVEWFEWYQNWESLKPTLAQYITPSHNILNIGAGNSRMSAEMFDEGFIHITNIDLSQGVITRMSEKYRDKQPTMKYYHMDARAMAFDDNSFDVVMDKGTLDSVLCGDASLANANKMLTEVHRVLSPTGVYISVSYAPPPQRKIVDKDEFSWSVSVSQVERLAVTLKLTSDESPSFHYIYICKKGAKTQPSAPPA